MSFALQKFFTDQAAFGLSLYEHNPILQVEVPGIVGKVGKKSDDKGRFFELSFIGSGENSEYPHGSEMKTVTVRQNDRIELYSATGNTLTLGRGKQILGFAAFETKLNVIDKAARLTREIPYPDHIVLGLSIAFLESGKVTYMLASRLATPQSVKDDPVWQRSNQSARCHVDIGI